MGEVFKNARDPEKLYRWYHDNLGLDRDSDGRFSTPENINYFSTASPAGLNFQVQSLEPLLSSLAIKGVNIEKPNSEEKPGCIAWIYDPEGNRIEFWEPVSYRESLINLPEPE